MPLSVSGLGVETVNVGKQMFCIRTGCGVVHLLRYVIQIIYRPKQTNVLSPCWVSTPIINLLVTRARRVQYFQLRVRGGLLNSSYACEAPIPPTQPLK